MKKFLSVFLLLTISVSFAGIAISTVVNSTDYLSADNFSNDLAKLVELGEKVNIVETNEIPVVDTNIPTNKTDTSSTNRIIVKSDKTLEPLDSVGYIKGYNDLHILQFDNSKSCESALEYYNSLACVEYAEEDVIVRTAELDDGVVTECAVSTVPAKSQSDTFGYTVAKSSCPTTYSVDVAVIDSGVQYDHPYLNGRVSPTGFNSVTEGGNCYDDRGHGTQVAGIIAATTKSNVTIYPYKALNKLGEGSASQVALAIDAAIEDYVDVINLSLNAPGKVQILYDSVLRAKDAGIIVVAASGNSGKDLQYYDCSPGNFEDLISVASCSNVRRISSFSNYGGNVDVAAPGEDILSTTIEGKYKISSGTSVASPFIVSAVCYLLSKTPNMSLEAVETALLNQTKPCAGTANVGAVYPATSTTAAEQTAAPVFALSKCDFLGSMNVTINAGEPNCDILYKTSSENIYTVYDGPFTIDSTTTVTAFATSLGKSNSKSVSVTYTALSGDSTQFVMDNNTLVGYNGAGGKINIPSYINGSSVEAISNTAFAGNTTVTSITLSETTTRIEAGAFSGCTGLTTFNGKNVLTIGNYAFANCNALGALSLDSVTDIGDYAFENTINLRTFTGFNVKRIGDYAFCNSGLISISISPETVGDYAFSSCQLLSVVPFSDLTDLGEGAFSDCTALNNFTSNSLSYIPDKCFDGCTSLTSIVASNINSIGSYAFRNCTDFTAAEFPSVATVGDYAFCGSSIRSATFNSADNFGEKVFKDCTVLTTVTLPNITSLSPELFEGSVNIKNLLLDNLQEVSVTDKKLSDTVPHLTSFTSANMLNIPDYMFKDCAELTSCSIPKAVSIGEYAFSGTKLLNLSLSSVKTAEAYAFENLTSLTVINMPSLQSFDATTFSGCSNVTDLKLNGLVSSPEGFLPGVLFPELLEIEANKLLSIPDDFLNGCTELKNLSFTGAVSIGSNAFYQCTGVEDMIFPLATDIAVNAFAESYPVLIQLDSYSDYNKEIFGPDKSVVFHLVLPAVTDLKGQTFEGFSELEFVELANLTELPDNCFKGIGTLLSVSVPSAKTIGNRAFYNCTAITDIDISSAESIGAEAFYNCNHLKTFIADSIKSIDLDVFEKCSSLVQLSLNGIAELPEIGTLESLKSLTNFSAKNVKAVPDFYFSGLSKLTNVYMNGATEVGQYAFDGCKNLSVLELGDVVSIGEGAFYDCIKISSFYLDSVKTIGYDVFTGCTNLAVLSLNGLDELPDTLDLTSLVSLNKFYSDGVSSIPDGTFNGNTNLTGVSFKNVNSIGDYAFANTNLMNCTIESFGNVTSVGDYAFQNSNIPAFNFKNVSSIGEGAFAGAKITDVKASNVSYLGEGAFENSTVKTADIDGITDAPDRLFKGTPLNSIKMPAVTEIGYEAFANTEIIDIRNAFSTDLYIIKDKAFYNCVIKSTAVPMQEGEYYTAFDYPNVSYIGNNAFSASTFRFNEAYELPKLTYIGTNALGNTYLNTLVLPNIEVIKDIPDDATILIGSAVRSISGVGNNVTIEAPLSSYAADYAIANDINFIVYEDNEIYKPYIDEDVYDVYSVSYKYRAIGFNLKYKWYGTNSTDLTDSVFLYETKKLTVGNRKLGKYSKFEPFAINNDYEIGLYDYKYFYCIAESTENGNVVYQSSPLYTNYCAAVSVKNSEDIYIDAGGVYSNYTNYEDTMNAIELSEGVDVVVRPSYEYGDVSVWGTGTLFEIYDKEGNLVDEVFLVVYGDVTGDGCIDVIDLSIISSVVNGEYVFDDSAISEATKAVACMLTDDYEITIEDYNIAREKALA